MATSWLAEDSLVGRAEAWAHCHVKFLRAAVGGWGEGEVFLFFVFFPTESKGGERAFGRRKALELSLGPAHSESRSWPCARQLEGAGGKVQWHLSSACTTFSEKGVASSKDSRPGLPSTNPQPRLLSHLPLTAQRALLLPHLYLGRSFCLVALPIHLRVSPGHLGSGLPSPWA